PRNVLLPRCTASRDAASPQRGTVLAPPSAHGRAIVAPMGPPKRRATYEDLMQVPDTKVAEIIDGELVVSPRPASRHAHAATVLGSDVTGPFHRGPGDPAGPGGWWILLEPELHLAEDVLVPDWAGWQRDRLPVFPDTPAFTQVPDWVCEVISPSTGRIDRSRKMRIYAREGVSHLWFVEPQLERLHPDVPDGVAEPLLAETWGRRLLLDPPTCSSSSASQGPSNGRWRRGADTSATSRARGVVIVVASHDASGQGTRPLSGPRTPRYRANSPAHTGGYDDGPAAACTYHLRSGH